MVTMSVEEARSMYRFRAARERLSLGALVLFVLLVMCVSGCATLDLLTPTAQPTAAPMPTTVLKSTLSATGNPKATSVTAKPTLAATSTRQPIAATPKATTGLVIPTPLPS
jgi:hypothetical protein